MKEQDVHLTEHFNKGLNGRQIAKAIGKKQAYFIGFFLADGYLSTKYNRITFGLSILETTLIGCLNYYQKSWE